MTLALLRLTQFLLAILLVALPAGCRNPDKAGDDSRGAVESLQRFTFSQGLMGVECRIVMYSVDAESAGIAATAAFERVAELDRILSDYRSDSELSLLPQRSRSGSVEVSHDLFEVLRTSVDLSRQTRGAFDVTHGQLYRLWRQARETGEWPSETSVATARSHGGWRSVVFDSEARRVRLTIPTTQLGVGGIGKGHAAQAALDVLADRACPIALVDLGGDLVLGDAPPGRSGWNVRVDDGFGSMRTIPLVRCAVATSGASEQFIMHEGRRYSHIIDPRTGWPLADSPTVTVIAPDGAVADALASAVSVLGVEEGRSVAAGFNDVTVIIHSEQ